MYATAAGHAIRVIWKVYSLTQWYETYCIKYAHIHTGYQQATQQARTKAQARSLGKLENCKQEHDVQLAGAAEYRSLKDYTHYQYSL